MISRTIRVILMGGIGTGKSTLSAFLKERGVETIDADQLGHQVLEDEAFEAVSRRWPQVVRDGRIDRAALAEIVFAHPEELRSLEELTHPHIAARVTELAERSSAEIVLVELPVAPTLLANSWIRVAVTAPEPVRIQRLVARGMTESDVRARIAAQPNPELWVEAADLVVDNGGSSEEIPALVDDLLERIRWLATGRDTPPP